MRRRFAQRGWLALLVVPLLLVAGNAALAQYSGQRVPCGILITNWDCGPCAPANQALDAYIPTQGNDVAIIRVHVWWPGPDDPIYLANVAQATFLVNNTPAGPDYAPHLWIDNIVDMGSSGPGYAGGYEARKLVPAPLEIDLDYDIANERVLGTIHVLDPMPAGENRLFAAVTEDDVFAPGTNGEDYHNQAFRRLYPDTDGVPVANAVGDQAFLIDTPLHFRWVFEKCRATVYVQHVATGEIMNAATMFLSEGGGGIDVADLPSAAFGVVGAAPNPFNPRTTVKYRLPAAGPAVLRIHDLAGRLVRTLVDGHADAGENAAEWNGLDDHGQPVPSGVYVARLLAGGAADSHKLVLAK